MKIHQIKPNLQNPIEIPIGEKLRVCLVHSPCLELYDDRLEPPLGLLYNATFARVYGYEVTLIDLSSYPVFNLENAIPDDYDIYGFSTYSVNYRFTKQLAQSIKKRNPNCILIAGGPHASALPIVVSEDEFDVVVKGEGELALVEIINYLQHGLPLPKTILGQPFDPLDLLPFPDYNLVDLNTYTREVNGSRCISILSSRGCPYPCVFCNSNIMGAGKTIRYRSPGNVTAEIREIKKKFGIRHFRFQDDIFTLNIHRVRELTPCLKEEDIEYRCFARVNTFSFEMAKLLRESGCIHVSFGVESGSRKILSKHGMHKLQSPEQIKNALENSHKVGLKTRIFLIVGFPGETDETIEETLTLMRSCPWEEFSVYPLIAYPGTPLHDRPEDFGITKIDRNYSNYLQIGRNFRAGFTIRTAEFDEEQVREWRDYVVQELLEDGRTWAGNSHGFK
ncbi:MAG: B12-binding domain-containing radical SAM protein [Candidatus Brocadia sp. WS118]|nr:MAG: B12-binding domain-containing radical SAM protein [Candidatus Brocadia sp. WS118]